MLFIIAFHRDSLTPTITFGQSNCMPLVTDNHYTCLGQQVQFIRFQCLRAKEEKES